ncbi:MAG TPA: DUF998 domain-containing protein [Acidimicrobiia bacterium]|nr:DUF998 domain-containing protein [Acidimicrobiia bacterium]
MTRLLLTCGLVGAALFVVTFLIDGATRPGYRPLYHPVSALALGSRGWVQTSNFVVTGVLMIAAAAGTREALDVTIAPALLALFGVGLVVSGVFTMDPMRGYPPGTEPGTPAVLSRRHKVHDIFGFVVFSSLAATVIAFAFALEGGWKTYSFATAVVVIVLFVLFGVAWERDSPWMGLLQRLTILVGWTWNRPSVSVAPVALNCRVWQHQRPPSRTPASRTSSTKLRMKKRGRTASRC